MTLPLVGMDEPTHTMLSFNVRPAESRDAAAIAEIAVEHMGGTFEQHRNGAAGEIEHQESGGSRWGVLVAEVSGTIAGFGRIKQLLLADGSATNDLPEGWYLNGLLVAPEFRRQGIGLRLTRERISRVAERADVIRYFTSLQNHASIALHERLGFREARRGISVPQTAFADDSDVLFEKPLP